MASPNGLTNQKLYYFQMLLNIEKSGEEDKECSEEWLVNTDLEVQIIADKGNHLQQLCRHAFSSIKNLTRNHE